MHITSTSDAGQKISKACSIPPSRGTSDFRIDLISETKPEFKEKFDSSNPASSKHDHAKGSEPPGFFRWAFKPVFPCLQLVNDVNANLPLILFAGPWNISLAVRSSFHQQMVCLFVWSLSILHDCWPGRPFHSCFARTPTQTQRQRRWINRQPFPLTQGQPKTRAPLFQKPAYWIKYFFLSVYSLTLYKRKPISKCKCSYKNSQHLFKFRNLFCLIHKLYIALVKKKRKQKTVKTWQYPKFRFLKLSKTTSLKAAHTILKNRNETRFMNGATTSHKQNLCNWRNFFLGLLIMETAL